MLSEPRLTLSQPMLRARTTARTRFEVAPRPPLLLPHRPVQIRLRKWLATRRPRLRRLMVTRRPRPLLILPRRPLPRPRNPRPRLNPLSQRPKYPARRDLLETWPGLNPSRCPMPRWDSSLRLLHRSILQSRNLWPRPSSRDTRKRLRTPVSPQDQLLRSMGQHREQSRARLEGRRQCPARSLPILAS